MALHRAGGPVLLQEQRPERDPRQGGDITHLFRSRGKEKTVAMVVVGFLSNGCKRRALAAQAPELLA